MPKSVVMSKLFTETFSELHASNSDLQIGARGRLRVQVLISKHAHFENFRPPNLKRVLSSENLNSQSSSYCNLTVANLALHSKSNSAAETNSADTER